MHQHRFSSGGMTSSIRRVSYHQIIMRPFLAFSQKSLSYRGAYRVPFFHILSVCVCVCDIEFVAFTDYESCTRSISTNQGPMEAGGYGLSRGTCFAARRLELSRSLGC